MPGCAGGSQSRLCDGCGQAGLGDVPGTCHGDRVRKGTGTALARREEGDMHTGLGLEEKHENQIHTVKEGREKAHVLGCAAT